MRRLALAMLFVFACFARPAEAVSCSTYASSLVFGTYFGSTIDVTGSVTVICPQGTAYDIGLNAGIAPGDTITTRAMTGGAGGQSSLGYVLYSNAAYTNNWGNSAGTGWVAGTGTGSAQTYTIYAQIPANEISPVGSYTDTITASVTGNFSTVTAQFSVTSTVMAGCNISANALNFGTYAGSLTNATTNIFVTCTPSTSYNVGLNAGTASGATVTTRAMTGPGTSLLAYSLFSNPAMSINWGQTIGANTVIGTGTGVQQSLTVYGQIPAGQVVNPGSYTDTITATVTY
ncbi:MAG: spore coat U domain-containing protein [Terracidiphilus sp.]